MCKRPSKWSLWTKCLAKYKLAIIHWEARQLFGGATLFLPRKKAIVVMRGSKYSFTEEEYRSIIMDRWAAN